MVNTTSKDLKLFIKAFRVARQQGLLHLFEKNKVLPAKEERNGIKIIATAIGQKQEKVSDLIALSW